jgi:hypothetical protein
LDELHDRVCELALKRDEEGNFTPELAFFRDGCILLAHEVVRYSELQALREQAERVLAEHFAVLGVIAVMVKDSEGDEDPVRMRFVVNGDRIGNRIMTFRAIDNVEHPLVGTYKFNLDNPEVTISDGSVMSYDMGMDPWLVRETVN